MQDATDELTLQQSTEEVIALNAVYEEELKKIGIELDNLPDDITELLEKYVNIQLQTKLHSMEPSFVEEYYYTQKIDALEQKLIAFRLEKENEKLNRDIANIDNDIKQLQECLKLYEQESRKVDEKELEQLKRAPPNSAKTKSSKMPFDLESIIEKFRLLESSVADK